MAGTDGGPPGQDPSGAWCVFVDRLLVTLVHLLLALPHAARAEQFTVSC
ncbi:hypothetical protein OG568_53130 (plasmid) [Streptomyces sp. NBC_01450]|nr:hypothetical protein [Streptomyces sp. NBC_01450]